MSVTQSCPALRPYGLQPVAHQTPLSMEFSRQNTGAGSHSLLQGIFLTQGSSSVLLHCRQILYYLRHQGSPNIGRHPQWLWQAKSTAYMHTYPQKLFVTDVGCPWVSSMTQTAPECEHVRLPACRLVARWPQGTLRCVEEPESLECSPYSAWNFHSKMRQWVRERPIKMSTTPSFLSSLSLPSQACCMRVNGNIT